MCGLHATATHLSPLMRTPHLDFVLLQLLINLALVACVLPHALRADGVRIPAALASLPIWFVPCQGYAFPNAWLCGPRAVLLDGFRTPRITTLVLFALASSAMCSGRVPPQARIRGVWVMIIVIWVRRGWLHATGRGPLPSPFGAHWSCL